MKTFKRAVGFLLLAGALSIVTFAGDMSTGMVTSGPPSFFQAVAQILIDTLTLLS